MMDELDQSGIIEQLTAENTMLREALRNSPDREIQIASAVNMVIDELTRLGPNATQRVLLWVFSRYGISQHIYARDIRDRRPEKTKPAAAPQPPPALITEKLGRRHALRQTRVAARLTQTALAEMTGIAAPRISQIELGNTKPSEDTWLRLENAIKETEH